MFKQMPNSVIGHTVMCNKLSSSMRENIHNILNYTFLSVII